MKAKIWNKSGWIREIDPFKLREKYAELLYLSKFDVINFQEHYFRPTGWTGLWLLGESHLAIHTFPEENRSYIELSSCNEEYFIYFTENIEYLET